MTLVEAAVVFFPQGPLTLSSLRRAAAAGTLEIAKVAGKDLTTPRAICKLVKPSCRAAKPNRLASGSEMTITSGSSSTVAGKSAQAAAAATLTGQRKRSKNTSVPGTPPPSAQPTPRWNRRCGDPDRRQPNAIDAVRPDCHPHRRRGHDHRRPADPGLSQIAGENPMDDRIVDFPRLMNLLRSDV